MNDVYPSEKFYKATIEKIVANPNPEEYYPDPANQNASVPPWYQVVFIDDSGNSSTTLLSSELNKFTVGDSIYLKNVGSSESPYLVVWEKMREPEIYGSLILFIAVVIGIFGFKGFKALTSLVLSFFIIFYLLIPGILNGYNPVLLSAGLASLLLGVSMFVTHGKSKVTYAALLGCTVSISITVALSYFMVLYSKLSGYIDESSYYIENGLAGPGTHINLSYLIIASIIIGVIGAVDDGAITQAGIVKELKKLNKNLSNYEYYKRAMNIGKNHGGAMINTLILAYVAGSIPDILFLYKSTTPFSILMNSEIIATEIFRSVISSVGLLLAIPLTTYFAILFISEKDLQEEGSHSHHHNHKH